MYTLEGRPMNLSQVEDFLLRSAKANPNLVVRIRADKSAIWDQVFQVADICANNNIKVSFRSEPRGAR
jgi:biopolymer transport protein ExbD